MITTINDVFKKIKSQEYRIGAPPAAVEVLTKANRKVLVQTTAGE